MGVQVTMPQAQQQTSMGRRLLGMAAPIVGGAFGGPAGAAIGGVVGSKLSGASAQDAIMGGLQSGIGAAGKAPVAPATDPTAGMTFQGLQKPELGDSAFGRRASALSQSPAVGIQEGLNALTELPEPLRKEYTPYLVKAAMRG